MRVLYTNHTGHVSGAEEALIDLVRSLPESTEMLAATPAGPLAGRLRDAGLPVHEIPATDGSLRLHPVQTPRALAELAAAGLAVARIARRERADVVHANSIRAGLSAVLAARAGAPRPVVHVHDCLPRGTVTRLTQGTIGRGAGVIVANSRHSAERFADPRPRAPLRVVYYGVDTERFDPSRLDRDHARARLGLGDDEVALAVVGQLTPWKGQDHAIRVLARLAPEHPELRLLLAGSAKFVSRATRFDNQSYVRHLHGLAADLGVADRVRFVGQVADVPQLLSAVDVALVPSWEEPFGRAVTEALAMRVPVVATNVGGPGEVVRAGEDGYLAPPTDVAAWTRAVERLAADPALRRDMGTRGRRHVTEAFPMDKFAAGMLDSYAMAR